jgi:2-oxo-3-hexenedioate decarboxylase/2-keto-4-pentenoate hydratase
MSEQDQSLRVARYLWDQHAARRPFAPLPAELLPASSDEAYLAQAALVQLNSDRAGPPAGYKVGLTTATTRRMLGIETPVAGVILTKLVHRSPYWLPAADFVHLGLECEIAIQLGADLAAEAAPFDRRAVLGAIETVMAAFEIIEDRQADHTQLAGQAISLISDNVWNAGAILGGPVANWRAVDLAAVRGKVLVNGALQGEGQGRMVMGHPLEALVWLANLLAAQGKSLAAGMVVLTGSIVPPLFVAAGDEVRFVTDTLGDVVCYVVKE